MRGEEHIALLTIRHQRLRDNTEGMPFQRATRQCLLSGFRQR